MTFREVLTQLHAWIGRDLSVGVGVPDSPLPFLAVFTGRLSNVPEVLLGAEPQTYLVTFDEGRSIVHLAEDLFDDAELDEEGLHIAMGPTSIEIGPLA